MHPILLQIGSYELRVWGLFVGIGIIAGTWLAWVLARRTGFNEEFIFDFAVYGIIAGVLGARLWEVIFSWPYYSASPLEAFKIWEGGLSIQGTIFGCALTLLWYVKKHNISFWRFADIGAPSLLLGQAIGRVGCLLNGCCPGVPTGSPWGVVYKPGTVAYGFFGSQPLVPAEFLEGMVDFAILGVLLTVFKRRPFPGFITTLYFILYSLNRFVLEFWRADSLRTLYNLKVAQVASLATIVIAFAVMVYLYARHKSAASGTSKTIH